MGETYENIELRKYTQDAREVYLSKHTDLAAIDAIAEIFGGTYADPFYKVYTEPIQVANFMKKKKVSIEQAAQVFEVFKELSTQAAKFINPQIYSMIQNYDVLAKQVVPTKPKAISGTPAVPNDQDNKETTVQQVDSVQVTTKRRGRPPKATAQVPTPTTSIVEDVSDTKSEDASLFVGPSDYDEIMVTVSAQDAKIVAQQAEITKLSKIVRILSKYSSREAMCEINDLLF